MNKEECEALLSVAAAKVQRCNVMRGCLPGEPCGLQCGPPVLSLWLAAQGLLPELTILSIILYANK